ncbi:MMPL family transporter [Paraoerskovia marina]|uniref:MMPL family transporter n=1 Tax=Paraoerskovia marina TaxID=545619 RepID=UPI0005BB7D35|nr:MMPL family transporter [Paraoerskovia marina]
MLSESRRGIFRGLIILAVLGAWLAVGAVGGQAQGKLGSVQTNDASAFLPESAESTQAADEASAFVDSDSLPALVAVEAQDGGTLDESQIGAVQAWTAAIADLPLEGALDDEPSTVGDVLTTDSVAFPSEDGEAMLAIVSIDAAQADTSIGEDETSITDAVVAALRDAQPELSDAGLDSWVTGPAGFVADLVTAFGGIDTVLLLVALIAVLVILAVVYRSPILPFMVILTAVLALSLAGLVVYQLAANDVLVLNGQSQGILSILVVGAAVDYSLLVVARYREELVHTRSTFDALRQAVRASIEPIAASAGTVIAGLLCLLFSDLASNRSLGPVAAIGIAAAFIAALTFLPALLVIGGQKSRGIFWPSKPKYVGPAEPDEDVSGDENTVSVEGHGVWSRVATFVGRHARPVWITTAAVLVGLSAFIPMLDATGTGDDEVFLTQVDSVDGQDVIEDHFDSVSAQPATVIAPADDLDAVVAAAEETDGVESAVPVTDAESTAPGQADEGEVVVVDDRVRIDVTTTASSDSQEAVETVEVLRENVHAVSDDVLVGGAAAERLDTQIAGQRDLTVIVPIVLLVVLGILMLLLRSVLAAVLLIAANVLSFGAALGFSAVIFDKVFEFPGADPSVPLFAFCFLVALGVDYSIFLMTRVREESIKIGTRAGVLRALAVTGSVITSAGVVLAATFAALGVIPLLFLAQLAFIVSFGVLLDTLVVRSLLVPALVHDIGDRTWWPSKLSRPTK